MRDLVVTQNVTVDGVVEAGDWFGPADGGSDVLDVLNEQASRADAFLTGRLTFEAMREYWPQQTDDTSGVTAYLNQVHKYVVSSTLQEPGWEPTTILRDLDDVRELKTSAGKDIVCPQHQPRARADRGRPRRRVPPVRLPHRGRHRPPALSRRDPAITAAD